MRSAPAQVDSVAALSRQAGMSPAHFSRQFKRLFGETPVHFWNRARVDRAAALLVETALPLAAIAEMLGYADVYHFSKQFARFHGQPPGTWRAARMVEG
jgi:transcriptional regulator GlxA family with amidase domain